MDLFLILITYSQLNHFLEVKLAIMDIPRTEPYPTIETIRKCLKAKEYEDACASIDSLFKFREQKTLSNDKKIIWNNQCVIEITQLYVYDNTKN